MSQANSQPPGADRAVPTVELQEKMRRMERREWWLWSSAVIVMVLLSLGVATFEFPALLKQGEAYYSFQLGQSVRGLVGLVLLFSIYTVYQHFQIQQIRRKLTEQISAVDKVEGLTAEVYKLAVLDSLTGLYNRRAGEQRLVEEISRAVRYGRDLSVLIIDLDGLKQINDKYGHAAGDVLLKTFAEGLRKAIRGSDLAARLGGDEFMVLLSECKTEEVWLVLQRLTGLKVDFHGESIPVTFSAGWTKYLPGELPDELLKRADDALYVDKRSRRERGDLRGAPV